MVPSASLEFDGVLFCDCTFLSGEQNQNLHNRLSRYTLNIQYHFKILFDRVYYVGFSFYCYAVAR